MNSSSASKPPRRWRRTAALWLGLALLGWFIWWCAANVWTGTMRLPDGRSVTVRAVTYGTNHVFVEAPLWLRAVRGLLSPARAARYGLVTHTQSSLYPSCVVWTEWSGSTNSVAPRYASVVDAHGIEGNPVLAIAYSPPLVAWQWESYPRRQHQHELRFYDVIPNWRYSLAGRMNVRLPPGEHWRWPVTTPPVTVTNGEVEFSLVSLRCGLEPSSPAAKGASPIMGMTGTNGFMQSTSTVVWNEATFRAKEAGKISADWRVRSLEVIGATGNHFLIPERNLAQQEFMHVFWPDEPMWKIITEFSRTQNHPAQELLRVEPVPVTRNPPYQTNLSSLADGVVLQQLKLQGVTSVRPYRVGDYHPNAEFTLLYSSLVERVRVDLARVVDDRGRELRFGHEAHPWRGKYEGALEIPQESRSLALTFSVQTSRFIPFLVKPVWTATNHLR